VRSNSGLIPNKVSMSHSPQGVRKLPEEPSPVIIRSHWHTKSPHAHQALLHLEYVFKYP